MRRLGVLISLMSLAAGCAAPEAVRVHCDSHLTPINAPQPGTQVRSVHP